MEHFDIYRKLGNAFELLAYSELHKDYSVEYLYREIYLPASLKQMYVYYDEDELPVGLSLGRALILLSKEILRIIILGYLSKNGIVASVYLLTI